MSSRSFPSCSCLGHRCLTILILLLCQLTDLLFALTLYAPSIHSCVYVKVIARLSRIYPPVTSLLFVRCTCPSANGAKPDFAWPSLSDRPASRTRLRINPLISLLDPPLQLAFQICSLKFLARVETSHNIMHTIEFHL